MTLILVFGDSVTWGAWDLEGGWVQRLRRFLDEKRIKAGGTSPFIYNLGISGNSSDELVNRFVFETEQRLKDAEPGESVIFILSVGSNDSLFRLSDKTFRCPLQKYVQNVKKLFAMARKYSSKILFIGETPIDDKRVDPVPWLPTHSYRNEYLKPFIDAARKSCQEEQIPFIDFFEEWSNVDHKQLLFDGIHPNSEGHERMFEKIRDFLIEKKWG